LTCSTERLDISTTDRSPPPSPRDVLIHDYPTVVQTLRGAVALGGMSAWFIGGHITHPMPLPLACSVRSGDQRGLGGDQKIWQAAAKP